MSAFQETTIDILSSRTADIKAAYSKANSITLAKPQVCVVFKKNDGAELATQRSQGSRRPLAHTHTPNVDGMCALCTLAYRRTSPKYQ